MVFGRSDRAPRSERLDRNELSKLVHRLEKMYEELGDKENKQGLDTELDEFTRLKRQLGKQLSDIRNMIAERDDLLSQFTGSGGKQSVQLSSQIREALREVHALHERLKARVAVEERDARKERKNSLTEDELETHRQVVELIAKHIEECEALEKKRYQSRVGGRGGAKTSAKGEIRRVAMETGLAPIEVDPELAEGLQQLQRNDEKLDEQLDVIAKGVQRLKGIAVDQSNEVKLQGVMIDQISDNMDKATDHLNDANTRLKETLEKAGGATSIIVKVILLVLLLSIGAYLYKALA